MNINHTIVVGGTKGIGWTFAKTLAEDNVRVSVIGRHPPKDKGESNISYWALDLKDTDRITEVCEEIVLKNGKVSNLIFFQRFRGDDDDWQGEIDVSLTATRNFIDCLTEKFDDGTDKSIVITSSIAGYYIAEEQPLSYHVAKAGLNQMVRYYATVLGPRGIRVNSISSGTVLKEESKEFYEKNEDLVNLYKEITPLRRMATAQEVANLGIFLMSSKASFITGQNVVIDGGVSLQGHETLARRLKSLGSRKITQ